MAIPVMAASRHRTHNICQGKELRPTPPRWPEGYSGPRRRAGRKGRSMTMTNAEYFRRQAATCLRLAKFCRDLEVARGLFGMAQEFKAKAAEIDADLQAMPLPALGRSSDAACG